MINLYMALFLLMFSVATQAGSIDVNSNQDATINDNLCTLREALVAANFDIAYFGCSAGSGRDLISLLNNATNDSIQLNSQLPIIDSVDIVGPGAQELVLFAANGNNDPIFQINTDQDVGLRQFRVAGANSSAIDVVNVDELSISGMRFLNNTAASDNNYGGAIHADTQDGTTSSINSLLVHETLFQGNQAEYGGAIAASGNYAFLISDSVFIQNTATETGSAVYRYFRGFDNIENVVTSILRSQFIENINTTIALLQQTADINESLFYNNSGVSSVSAINSRGAINNSIFAGRNSGQAVIVSGISTTSASIIGLNFNTFLNDLNAVDLVVGNFAAASIIGNAFAGSNPISCQQVNPFTLTSSGYNLEASGSSCTLDSNDLSNTEAMLMPLNSYGGNVLIAPPFPLSPLVDAGFGCNNSDISDEGRSRDGDADGQARCDIGAVERPAAHNLILGFPGEGEGEISLTDFALTCQAPDSCTWPLPQNETYSFNASANAGSTFIQWGGSCTGDTTCDITMNNFNFLTADFSLVLKPVNLTVSKFGSETNIDALVTSSPAGINCGPICTAGFVENDVIELIAVPNENTVIDTWSGCDSTSEDGLTCTVTLNTDTNINLFYVPDPDLIFKNGFE